MATSITPRHRNTAGSRDTDSPAARGEEDGPSVEPSGFGYLVNWHCNIEEDQQTIIRLIDAFVAQQRMAAVLAPVD